MYVVEAEEMIVKITGGLIVIQITNALRILNVIGQTFPGETLCIPSHPCFLSRLTVLCKFISLGFYELSYVWNFGLSLVTLSQYPNKLEQFQYVSFFFLLSQNEYLPLSFL